MLYIFFIFASLSSLAHSSHSISIISLAVLLHSHGNPCGVWCLRQGHRHWICDQKHIFAGERIKMPHACHSEWWRCRTSVPSGRYNNFIQYFCAIIKHAVSMTWIFMANFFQVQRILVARPPNNAHHHRKRSKRKSCRRQFTLEWFFFFCCTRSTHHRGVHTLYSIATNAIYLWFATFNVNK